MSRVGLGAFGEGGEGVRWGCFSSFFFLPPMTPSPPFGFFGGSWDWDWVCGAAGVGLGEALGLPFRCGAGSGSGWGFTSDAVGWSVFSAGGCGERLFFFTSDTGGEIAGVLFRVLNRGGVSCR